jgi:hypothetical protein
MVLGMLAMAMPITVLGSNFQTQFDEEKRRMYVSNRDRLKSLELGLLGQGDNLDEANTAGEELTDFEYQKLCKVQVELAEKSGASASEQANVQRQKKRLVSRPQVQTGAVDSVLDPYTF